ncbi:MAG: hypothetical protein AB7P97_20375 [Hyphomonadaceae bacterium]
MNGQQIVQGGGRGWENRSAPPGVASLAKYNPNRPDAVEGIWQPLYDFQTYAMAGQTQLNFFQVPQGQSSKTLADTNMTIAGSLPNPQAFFCTGVMIDFNPLNVVSAIGAAALRVQANANDVAAVGRSGFLEFQIGSKVYLQDAPLNKFATNYNAGIDSSISAFGTAAAPAQVDTDYAKWKGRYYAVTPFLIPPTQNFSVRLNWPTAVAVTVAARIGVILDGFLYRQSQ